MAGEDIGEPADRRSGRREIPWFEALEQDRRVGRAPSESSRSPVPAASLPPRPPQWPRPPVPAAAPSPRPTQPERAPARAEPPQAPSGLAPADGEHPRTARPPVSRAWELQIALFTAATALAGLALLGLAGELQYWLDVGGALVAFALAFDLYARLIGALAARAAGGWGWTLACVLLGSPAVAAHAVFKRTGPGTPEPGSLAGLAALALVLALLVASLAGA